MRAKYNISMAHISHPQVFKIHFKKRLRFPYSLNITISDQWEEIGENNLR